MPQPDPSKRPYRPGSETGSTVSVRLPDDITSLAPSSSVASRGGRSRSSSPSRVKAELAAATPRVVYIHESTDPNSVAASLLLATLTKGSEYGPDEEVARKVANASCQCATELRSEGSWLNKVALPLLEGAIAELPLECWSIQTESVDPQYQPRYTARDTYTRKVDLVVGLPVDFWKVDYEQAGLNTPGKCFSHMTHPHTGKRVLGPGVEIKAADGNLDEYANNVDAGGFTMPLVAETLSYANAFRQQFGIETNSTWDEMAANVLVLRENGVTLEFTTMNGSAVVKQADVILDTYPLDYATQDPLNDLDYYANKQSPDGPAMAWAIFSIVANEMSPSGCSAFTYGQYSYKPYVRAPFFQMSEQLIDDAAINGGTHPAFPFLTGHGGANQVALFGYLGLRLLPDDYLHVYPNLPPQIPYLKYRTFYWHGWPIDAWSNYTHTIISRATDAQVLDTADQRFANQTITVRSGTKTNFTMYSLPASGSLVIPNLRTGSRDTITGNLVQCQPVQSVNTFQPGQFPISVVDGASSTKWQPAWAANMSAVTVSFGSEAGSMVSGFYFDWAQAPPVNATVIFHNQTLGDPTMAYYSQSSNYQIVASLHNIALSDPYNPQTTNLDVIAIPSGNTTNVTLAEPVPATKYASLLIVGNHRAGSELDPVWFPDGQADV
ncbi:uncharacterized protein N7446_010827 [Penicillium canescens]|uniref:PD-(D/E)XK nuclease-like domain-containing protein n=1 Tax=Penicillium canescens TaxID=5083 RepID=A0AAD6N7Y5_PENCN|nr:uncharacterized protein N7446_010827 [Penicillium canescens]KAJ6041282.1 hypothetical protein N7460_006672 [Penicillium canescens]KAJ6050718.1 hypothetical protein N7446_010827 [Penicillium canescens]KAJ6065940.1 hypothetical protein N7444_001593 [Penicillium canescens]